MKKNILTATCIVGFLLAALSSNAQQGKAPAAQVAADNAQITATQTNTKDAKPPLQPGANAARQSSGKSDPVVVSKQFKAEELKTAEMKNAPVENSNSMKNIDRPKTSTIQTNNKVERPMAATGPTAPNRKE